LKNASINARRDEPRFYPVGQSQYGRIFFKVRTYGPNYQLVNHPPTPAAHYSTFISIHFSSACLLISISVLARLSE